MIKRYDRGEDRPTVDEVLDYLNILHHELRSPLQHICFAPERLLKILEQCNLVQRENIPPALTHFLEDLKATANRLSMIVSQQRFGSGTMDLSISEYNLFYDCLSPVLTFSSIRADKMKRSIHADIESLKHKVSCDANGVSLAFFALLENAIKYSDRNSKINVYGVKTKINVRVIIENQTTIFPIQNEELEFIFQKSYRGSAAISQKLEGSGIGLFLARQIMTIQGGDVMLVNGNSPVQFALIIPLLGDADENYNNRR